MKDLNSISRPSTLSQYPCWKRSRNKKEQSNLFKRENSVSTMQTMCSSMAFMRHHPCHHSRDVPMYPPFNFYSHVYLLTKYAVNLNPCKLLRRGPLLIPRVVFERYGMVIVCRSTAFYLMRWILSTPLVRSVQSRLASHATFSIPIVLYVMTSLYWETITLATAGKSKYLLSFIQILACLCKIG